MASDLQLSHLVLGASLLIVVLGGLVRTVRVLRLRLPGPWLCKLTPWALRWRELKGERENFIEELHQRYGDVVQLTPDEVSIRSAPALREVYVSHKLDKPDSLVLEQFGEKNLVTTEDVALHARRRKVVSAAYTAPTIVAENSQKMFRNLVGKFAEQIDAEAHEHGGIVNIWPLLRFLATDIMTQVVFGPADALNSLEVPEHRRIVRLVLIPVEQTMSGLGVLLMGWYPGFMRLFTQSRLCPNWLKGFADQSAGLHGYVQSVVDKRLQQPTHEKGDSHSVPTHVDLLIANYRQQQKSNEVPSPNYIASDSLDHLFAGSLTSADTMSWMIWQMCLPENRSRQLKLRQELIDAGIKPGQEISLPTVNRLPYLYNVIRETLRLFPPIPFTEPRLLKRGQELVVDGHSIPVGHVSVQRRPNVFANPEDWNPERWDVPSDSEEGREMMRHFWPFSSGQRTCIGMHIAWAEIRLVASKVFSTYEVSFPKEWLDKDGTLLAEAKRQHLFPKSNVEPICFRKLEE